jgi:membrane-bound lytic murein transglycosylase D
MAAQTSQPSPSDDARPAVARASMSTTRGESASRERQVYRVKRGDTLSSIARLFETSVSSIKQWNRLRSNRINPGQRLTVYTQSE